MRHDTSVSAEVEWTFVSLKHPCTICSGHEGCRSSGDDEFACCTQRSSEWPLSAGGWVHRVSSVAYATSPRSEDPSAGARQELGGAAH